MVSGTEPRHGYLQLAPWRTQNRPLVMTHFVPSPVRFRCKEKPYKTMRAVPDRQTRLGNGNLTVPEAQKRRLRGSTDRQAHPGHGSFALPKRRGTGSVESL